MRFVVEDFGGFGQPELHDGAQLLLKDVNRGTLGPAALFADEPVALCTADATMGNSAISAGGRRLPHPALITDVATDTEVALFFFELDFARDRLAAALAALNHGGIVPCHRNFGESPYVIGVATGPALDALASAGWPVAQLGEANLPESHDLYLMRDADLGPQGFAGAVDQLVGAKDGRVLRTGAEGIIVALPADRSIEALHFPVTQHGHNLKLLPDPALIARYGLEPAVFEPASPDADLTREEAAQVRELLPDHRVAEVVERLSGFVNVGDAPIESRHIHHPDGIRAVEEIERMLAATGLTPSRHSFVHEGRVLDNVHAELAGVTDELILITAHLDSRAGRGEPEYDPAHDAAPGADDDASGVAAVICAAQVLTAMAQSAPLRRSIRFALFNAEEHGLIGSRYYARAAAAADLRIAGVLQMDMIGLLKPYSGMRFEIHIGCRDDPVVERRSEPLAEAVARAASLLGELGASERYRSPPDIAKRDPADGRSDHSSFHLSGYPATIVSEDFFGGAIDAPADAPNNPNYHSQSDTVINVRFAAAIARAVTLAAWGLRETEAARGRGQWHIRLTHEISDIAGCARMPWKRFAPTISTWHWMPGRRPPRYESTTSPDRPHVWSPASPQMTACRCWRRLSN